MGSAPNFNPPASSVAVHATVYRPGRCAGDLGRGENSDPERGSAQVKCVPARTEAQFHEGIQASARDRVDAGTRRADRRDGSRMWAPCERSTAAGSEGHATGMEVRDGGRNSFGNAAKTPPRRVRAHASKRHTMKNATEPRQNTLRGGHRCRPPGRVNAIGRGVWRHCGAGWTRPLSGPAWKSAGPRINPTRKTTRGALSRARRPRFGASRRSRRSNGNG